MKDVTINKADLLAKLEENKQRHEEAFHEASEAFYTKLNSDIAEAARLVKEKKINFNQFRTAVLNETAPEGHCDDYERLIQMLKYEIEAHITLSSEDFMRYVLDEWHWKTQFATSYHAHTGKFLS